MRMKQTKHQGDTVGSLDDDHSLLVLFLLSVPVEILGQSGVQFFVDAGMPIDDALVNELVRDVIQDQINNMAAGLKTTLDTEREPSSAPQDEPTDRVIIGRPRTHAPIESTNRAQQVVHNQVIIL